MMRRTIGALLAVWVVAGCAGGSDGEPRSEGLSCDRSMSMVIDGGGTAETEIDALKEVVQADASLRQLKIDPNTVGATSGPDRTVEIDGPQGDDRTEWLVYSDDLAVFHATVVRSAGGGYGVDSWDACVPSSG